MSNEVKIKSAVTGRDSMVLNFDDDMQYLVDPVTGKKTGIVDPETPISGGTDLSGVTALAADVTSGTAFVTSDGTLTSGTLPVVAPPTPTISINSSTGVVSAAYTPLAGRVTDTAAKSATLQLQTVGASSYTPGSAAIVISGGRYLTGSQTIAGDAALVGSNIVSGTSIFGVAGTHACSSSVAASLAAAKVVNYAPYRAAFTGVTSVAVSGFSTYDQWGEEVDVSYLNGTYNVTSETQYVTDPKKRIYKHATANYYLFHIYSDDWGEHFWCFASSASTTDLYSMIFAKSGETLPSGSNSWYNYNSDASVTATTTPTTTSYLEQQFALSAADVDNVTSGGVWSFANSSALSGCDFEPLAGYIHLRNGGRIISPPIAHPGPGVAPVFSLPLHLDAVSPTGHSVTTTGAEYEFVRKLGRECCHFTGAGFTAAIPEQAGSGARTLSAWFCNLPNSGWCELLGFGTWTNGDYFDLFFRMGDQYLRPNVLDNGLYTGSGIDLNNLRTAWTHIVFTVAADGSAATYINGTLCDTASLGSAPLYTKTALVVNGDSGSLYCSDINLFAAALAADQVAALYKKEALYMGTIVR